MVGGIRLRPKFDGSTHGNSPTFYNLVGYKLKEPLLFLSAAIPFISSGLVLIALMAICRVPKELISRFVKICPTCQVRRGGSHISPPNSPISSPRQETASRSPSIASPTESGRGSFARVSLAEASQNGNYAHNHSYVSWTDNPQHMQGQINANSGLVPPFTMRSVNLLTNTAPTSLNPLLNDNPGTSGHVSNYNPGYISTQGNPRHHNY